MELKAESLIESNSMGWIRPFLSVSFIALALFFVAFLKMEVRRLGYNVWRNAREERRLRDLDRDLQIQIARAVRPERMAKLASQKLTLKKADRGQIIQMTESGIALEQ